MILNRIFSSSLIITLLVFIILLMFSIIIGYENTLSALIHLLKFEKYETQIKVLISENKFHYLQCGIFILIISIIFIFKFRNSILKILLFYFHDLVTSFVKSCKVVNDKKNIVILLIPIFAIIYYAISLPISFDEALTFSNFSSKNFIVSLTYYPAPNNHIFHSLLTNFTYLLFSSFPLFSLRLPTVISSILLFMVALYSINKHYSKNISIISVGLFSVLFMGIYYGFLSRGYTLVLLFFIASFHFVLNLIKNPSTSRNWIWLSVFSILGFFTMPSYLYAYLIINAIVLLFNFNKAFFLNQLKFALITCISVLVLYLPTIIVSGLKALTSNKFVEPLSREIVLESLPTFLLKALEEIAGFNSIVFLSIVFISFILLIKNKDWFHTKLFTLSVIIPPLLLLIHSVIPYSRTFNYYGFIFVLLFCVSTKSYLEKIQTKVVVISVICIQLLLIFNFNNKIYKLEDYSIVAQEINAKIINNNKSYLVNSGLFDSYLLFYFNVNKTTNFTIKYYPSIDMSADTINNYNYVIIDSKKDKTTLQKPFYASEFFNVYTNKID